MNLPEQFVQRTKILLGKDWDAFENALALDAPTSIRINTSKSVTDNKFEKIPWADSGYYLPERPNFTFDPLLHAGCYYPQEASSMFIGQVFKQYITETGMRVLDLCAAPGGKSTHILSLLDESSLLVSNEVIRTRANVLAENVTKWGKPNVIVTNNDPAEIGKIKNYFNVILVDAPCSGEGMFRKDADAMKEWSVANVRLCKERQQRIVADVWDSLKAGGLLIYSTCTYNTEENEENVQWMCETLGAETVPLDVPDEWNITGSLKGNMPVYRFLPHRTKGEGFFMAVLQKNGIADDTSYHKKGKIKKPSPKVPSFPQAYKNYLIGADNFSYILINQRWVAVPSLFYEDYTFLSSSLRVVSAGIEIGEQKGKDLIPSQSLAMSVHADLQDFTLTGVDWDKAISFLRKETFPLPEDTPKGYALLSYRNVLLGFVKNIGNRANNLYPNEWRIRTSHIPDSYNPFF